MATALVLVSCGGAESGGDAAEQSAGQRRNARLGRELCEQADLALLDELHLAEHRPDDTATFLAAQCSWSSDGTTLTLQVGGEAEMVEPLFDRADATSVSIPGTTRAARFEVPLIDDELRGATVVLVGPRGFGMVEVQGAEVQPKELETTAANLAAVLDPS